MPLILNVIPPQGFEITRDRIGEILADEISSQVAKSYNTDIDAAVYVERSNQIDKTELPLINISLSTGSYDNKNQGHVNGTYTFDIDAYTHAKSTEDESGDVLAAMKLQRILGVCRAILENPIYKTLGYEAGFILRTGFSDINIAIPGAGKLDTLNTLMGRLSFTVVLVESTELIVPQLIAGYDTSLKLELTDNGYKYVGNAA